MIRRFSRCMQCARQKSSILCNGVGRGHSNVSEHSQYSHAVHDVPRPAVASPRMYLTPAYGVSRRHLSHVTHVTMVATTTQGHICTRISDKWVLKLEDSPGLADSTYSTSIHPTRLTCMRLFPHVVLIIYTFSISRLFFFSPLPIRQARLSSQPLIGLIHLSALCAAKRRRFPTCLTLSLPLVQAPSKVTLLELNPDFHHHHVNLPKRT